MKRLFLVRVMDCIKKYNMILEGDAVLIGVSGGIDSITLLYSLYFLRDDLKCSLMVAHANHGLRGEESDREADFVSGIADELKLPCVIEKLNVLEYMAERGLSKQAAARELRYDFFKRAANRLSASKIALGHNADDQAETILMRLLRGSGMRGIAGIGAVRDNRVIRPLIETSRDEITDFVREKGLRYVEDSSNIELYYLRNKIRLKLIPLLKQEYNPNITGTLKENAEIIRDEDEFLESYCLSIIPDIVISESKGLIELDTSKLKALHIAIQRRILRAAVKKVKGNLLRISALHIDDILNSINKGFSGKSLNLPDGIRVFYEYDKLKLFRESEVAEEAEIIFDIPLKIPGETILSMPSFKFKTEIISSVPSPQSSPPRGEGQGEGYFGMKNRYTAFFNMDKIEGELRVRNRRSGDIFHPSGIQGSKKLKEFFIDEKIPRRERDHIPLVVSGDTILWVVGKRVTDTGRVDNDTKKILKISVTGM
ncbi:MAG: tRNA lysidine(34) synthetase TilS [Nitrospinae bacterium]|nr:tRNA lysidine(34) synthetase TilS [Nitrospinota bacterium]